MNLLRELASLGRSARMEAKLKVRQPLSGMTVILNDNKHLNWLKSHDEILTTELNILELSFTSDVEEFVDYKIIPNFKRLGPQVGKLMPAVKKVLGDADGGAMLAELESSGKASLQVEGNTIELDSDDIEVRLAAKSGCEASQGKNAVVVVCTELTEELIRAGMAKDIVRFIQDQRKSQNLDHTDRIRVNIIGGEQESLDSKFLLAIEENVDSIKSETLALSVTMSTPEDESSFTHLFGDVLKSGSSTARERVDKGWRKYECTYSETGEVVEVRIFVDSVSDQVSG